MPSVTPCSTAAVALAMATARAAARWSGVARASTFGLVGVRDEGCIDERRDELVRVPGGLHPLAEAREGVVGAAEHGDGAALHAGDVDGH